MASVFRIFLLLVLIGGAFVAAAMFLDKGNPGDNVPSENGAMSEKQGKAQAILDIVEKQAQATFPDQVHSVGYLAFFQQYRFRRNG